jgi:hypothetical protein
MSFCPFIGFHNNILSFYRLSIIFESLFKESHFLSHFLLFGVDSVVKSSAKDFVPPEGSGSCDAAPGPRGLSRRPPETRNESYGAGPLFEGGLSSLGTDGREGWGWKAIVAF